MKVELVGRTDWIHHFVLRSEEELDDDLFEWMREAYEVGIRRISPGGEYGGNVKDQHLARTFVQRAGLETRPSMIQIVETIRNIPYARPTERTAEGVVAEWRGTCSTKTALLIRLTRYWFSELEPRVAHRLYHLTPESAGALFGPRVASAIPEGGITDVHTYATLHVEEGRVVVDVTFPGVAWDGSSDMPLSCGDGKDVDGGVDPWETKARLVSEHCDPRVRDPFIETLSH